MAHNSNPARQGVQQPPFEIVLDEGCSIVCDEMPVNCRIRVMPVDGRSPPRMSPVSQWVEDYSSSGGPPEGQNWGPRPRDKHGKLIGSPISSPPSPARSRRSIAASVRRNIQENTGATSSSSGAIHKGFGGAEYDIFAFRKPYSQSESPSPTPSFTSAASYYTTLSSRQPTPPPAEQSASTTDRLLNTNRPQMAFRRANIHVDGRDLREMHPNNSGPAAAPQQTSPAVQSAQATDESERPQSRSASSASSSSPPSPPSPSKAGRCCGMAEYNPADYGSKAPETPEKDRSKTPEKDRSTTPERDYGGAISVSSTSGGPCTYHGIEPCPTRARSRCRENRPGQSSSSSTSGSPGVFQGGRSCKYHNTLPCPVLAGVPCRYTTDSASAAVAASTADVVAPPAGHLRSVVAAPVGHLRITVGTSV